jgi:RNA polymerase sigma-70 factor (ECF subfamily)
VSGKSRADAKGVREAAAEAAELLQRFRRGEEAAFEQLFRQYREAIHGVVWRMLGDADEALDVVQEAFIRAHRGAAKFRQECTFFTWMRRIAVNVAIEHLRSRHAERSGELDEETLDEQAHGPGAARLAAEDPLEGAAGRELAEALEVALSSLGEEHRTTILLSAREGLSYKEIAEAMDCPIGTVMSRLFYARQTLAGKLRRFMEK